jgi:ribosomal-protein-alanine N-acetyltransferase
MAAHRLQRRRNNGARGLGTIGAMDPAPAPADDLPRLETARLLVVPFAPKHAPAVVEFLARNDAHFAPWDPPRPIAFLTEGYWVDQAERSLAGLRAGRLVRWVATTRDDPMRVVARANFTEVALGPFRSCLLGYQVDKACEGRGLMAEMLGATIDFAFTRWNLHRIEANHVPENERSARLLARLGFDRIGVARNFLFINGAWRDHVLNQLINPCFDDASMVPPT